MSGPTSEYARKLAAELFRLLPGRAQVRGPSRGPHCTPSLGMCRYGEIPPAVGACSSSRWGGRGRRAETRRADWAGKRGR
jgi:hypothetical protein